MSKVFSSRDSDLKTADDRGVRLPASGFLLVFRQQTNGRIAALLVQLFKLFFTLTASANSLLGSFSEQVKEETGWEPATHVYLENGR